MDERCASLILSSVTKSRARMFDGMFDGIGI